MLIWLQQKMKIVSLTGILLVLGGCASTQYAENERDPWQGFNRSMYSFNDTLDQAILKPVAKGYQAITPSQMQNGIRNFFANLDDVSIGVNNLLQGKVGDAFSDFGRVIVNSTVGILGLFDVASSWGMRKHNEDFGQTLAKWGVDEGPYVVLPFFCPSTMRDTPSIPVYQWLLDPMTHVELSTNQRLAVIAVDKVSLRAELLSLEATVEEISTDKYAFIREAYLDRRNFLIHDGVLPVDEDLYQQLD